MASKSLGLLVHLHPTMGLKGMLSVLDHQELCLAVEYKAKLLPKTCLLRV